MTPATCPLRLPLTWALGVAGWRRIRSGRYVCSGVGKIDVAGWPYPCQMAKCKGVAGVALCAGC